ncbi:MAG: SDR family NAD(P)-dependent oxidoreductase, partial [Myxococcales bacterium]|nr:SDR family NAD(P)-dependent oxidoreductase [Myxococcales bacterium]
MKIEGAAVLVTGGASGLGEATVRALVGAGAKAVIVDMNAERGDALVKELGADKAIFVKTDVSKEDEVKAAVEAAGKLGTLRIAVNCAGVGWASRPWSIRQPSRTPKSPVGSTSGRPSRNISSMCTVHGPIPRTAVRRSTSSRSYSVPTSSLVGSSPAAACRARSCTLAALLPDNPAPRSSWTSAASSCSGGGTSPPNRSSTRP